MSDRSRLTTRKSPTGLPLAEGPVSEPGMVLAFSSVFDAAGIDAISFLEPNSTDRCNSIVSPKRARGDKVDRMHAPDRDKTFAAQEPTILLPSHDPVGLARPANRATLFVK